VLPVACAIGKAARATISTRERSHKRFVRLAKVVIAVDLSGA
jgi:hypothetical protein